MARKLYEMRETEITKRCRDARKRLSLEDPHSAEILLRTIISNSIFHEDSFILYLTALILQKKYWTASSVISNLIKKGQPMSSDFYDIAVAVLESKTDYLAVLDLLHLMGLKEIKYLKKYLDVLIQLAEHKRALQYYRWLYDNTRKSSKVVVDYARCLHACNITSEAIQTLKENIVETDNPAPLYWELANIRDYQFTDFDVERMEQIDASTETNSDSVYIKMALGAAYESKCLYEKSFKFYESGNQIRRSMVPYNSAENLDKHEAMKSEIKLIGHGSLPKDRGDIIPIFLVGMHRSGSTLLEQILSCHPDVADSRELKTISRIAENIESNNLSNSSKFNKLPIAINNLKSEDVLYWRQEYFILTKHYQKGKKYLIDKMPSNYFYIGLINRLFPEARIIDCRRSIMGSGFSIYKQIFSDYWGHTNDLIDIANYHKSYVSMMNFWQSIFSNSILKVNYERLVTDFDLVVNEVLNFCGLEDCDSCHNYFLESRVVSTPSASQVRKPIYTSAIDHWRNYMPFLEKLHPFLNEE